MKDEQNKTQNGQVDKLEGWKQIAKYLQFNQRTVQRQEKKEGLPVYRDSDSLKARVFAFKRELDQWKSGRTVPPAQEVPPRIKRRYLKYFIGIPSIAAAIFTTMFFLVQSKEYPQPVDLKIINSELIILDEDNRELWRYKPPGYEVFKAYFIESIEGFPMRQNIGSEKIIIAYLTPLNSNFFLSTDTINTTRFDNRITLLHNPRDPIDERSFCHQFFIDTQDFLPATYFDSKLCSEQDIDSDGKFERVFVIRHQGSMFPSAFSIENEGRFFTMPNPGTIEEIVFPKTDTGSIDEVFLFGQNNLMAHSSFVANLSYENKYFLYSSFPSIVDNAALSLKGSRPPFLYILPQSAIERPIRWFKDGFVEFKETISGQRVSLSKEGVIRVYTGKKVEVYEDKPQTLQKVYDDIDVYFMEKLVHGRIDKAYGAVCRALTKSVENPFLLSVLYYFKGDLEILMGNFKSGTISIEQALQKNPANNDAAQRYCELEFLSGNITKSIELTRSRFAKIKKFWGMQVGKLLYIFYCHLHQGDYHKASRIIPEIQKHYPQVNQILQATYHIFKGEYPQAVELLQRKFNIRNKCTTVQDFRFLISRALTLSGQEREEAERYLDELASYSRTRNHLAKVSLAYLQVKKGDKNAGSAAKSAFSKIKEYGKGDFETRLWLFYDAFIYAKTMELIGDKEEALRGYRKTIEANRTTELAKDANLAIQRLSSIKIKTRPES